MSGAWNRVEELLDEVLDLPAAERGARLDRGTDDPEVVREVRRLLRLSDAVGDFLARPAAELAAPLVATIVDAAALPVTSVGPYRIIAEIGHGGMGTVYHAERGDGEFRQRVALKLVRGGSVHDVHLLRRFREERQILASLEHPNVARLVDGGVTEEGLPYFAMEYVEGTPIDRYCDDRGADIPLRLELFRKVCDAVQYAHRNLVVHRDIKPANVLVGADGEPKLLDFGIARLLDPSVDAGAELTGTGMRLLTPEYASPEQMRGEPVSTATDVYSLGMLLHVLLAGRHPYADAPRTHYELQEAVLHGEPEPPSVGALRAGSSLAARRSSTPARLRSRLRGDLDAIVLRATRKEPARRYGSVEQLAADLERHRTGLPVAAHGGRWSYRAGKFLRRHRLRVGAAALLSLSLVGGLVSTQRQAHLTRLEAARVEAVRDFLISLFDGSAPEQARGEDLTALQLLDRGAERVEAELAGESELQAELQVTLAATYRELAQLDRAQALVERALRTRLRLHGERHPAVARALRERGKLHLERGELDAAERDFRAALGMVGRGSGTDADVINGMHDVGLVLMRKGELDAAESMLRESLALERGRSGDRHLSVAAGLNTLGILQWRREKHADARALHEEALDIRRERLDEDHPDVITSLFNLARTHAGLGDAAAAERLEREVLERRRRLYRGAHPILATTLSNLGTTLSLRGAMAEAEALFDEAIAMNRALLGPDHLEVGVGLNNLGVLHYRNGNLAAAEVAMREVLRIWEVVHGTSHPDVATALNNLGAVLSERDAFADAEPHLVRALEMRRRLLGDGHAAVAQSLRNLGRVKHRSGQLAAAERLLEDALATTRAALPEGHVREAEVLESLGALRVEQGRAVAAEAMLRTALAIRMSAHEASDRRIAIARTELGAALRALGRHGEAEPLLQQSFATLSGRATEADSVAQRRVRGELAALYTAWGRHADALRYRTTAR